MWRIQVLWAALGMFGVCLFGVVAAGTMIMGVAFLSGAPHALPSSPGVAAGCFAVAALAAWLAFLSGRASWRRLRPFFASSNERRS